jgi:hypothetical protein
VEASKFSALGPRSSKCIIAKFGQDLHSRVRSCAHWYDVPDFLRGRVRVLRFKDGSTIVAKRANLI